MTLPKLLSKTKLMRGYQCLKSIYLTIHHKELEPPVTPEQQAIFDQGTFVGVEARKRIPGGILVDNKPWDFFGSLKKTRELLANETEVIYEAAFEYKGCYARADIIKYNKHSGRWIIYEAKSTTKIKDEHLDDISLQAWIMAKSGLPIEQINLIHLNKNCKYPDLSNLFEIHDVTEEIRLKYNENPPKIQNIFKVLQEDKTPDIDIGSQCYSPNPCPFIDYCFKEKQIPETSIFNLYKIDSRKWDLYKEGILKLDDPRLTNLTPIQQRIIEVYKSNERFVDTKKIKEELSTWNFPLIFLDFESINPAIPRYNGTNPYQQVPYQFSVHIWHSQNEELIHKEYLHTDASDPRPNLIPKLLEACGNKGTIICYYSQFEIGRIQELAEFSEENKDQLESLISRIKDPLPLIRDTVYDNAFHGSFSLKEVAPALLGKVFSYEGMLIDNGSAAQRAFEEIINPDTPVTRKNDLIKASLEYCLKDTLVMVELVKWMKEL